MNATKASFLFAVVIMSLLVSRNSWLISHPQMPYAIVFDLTFTLPLAYLFFIRKARISKLTAIPVFVFGLFFASFILPSENSLLHVLKMTVLPALEIGVLGFAGYTIFKARKTFQTLKTQDFDLMENLRQTLAREFPSPALGRAAAFEIAVFYYAFFKWRGEKRDENTFSYHREKGVSALISVFIFMILAETIVLHFLVANWSSVAAWILTALSAYFVFQIFAHFKAVLLRPIKLGENEISIRCGIIGDAKIGYAKIEKIELVNQPFDGEKDALKITAAIKMIAPNVKITLRDAEVYNGFYGFEKKFAAIFLVIDEAEKFKFAIENKLANIKQEKGKL